MDEMTSSYKSFKELREREEEGRDYRIRMTPKDGQVLVMAPHGGKIEPGTAEIAEAIAGPDYSFYSFEGLKADGNSVLHVESHLFDEPRALEAIEKAYIVITIHGQLNRKDAFVMIGGLNDGLGSEIKRGLEASGFQTRPPTEGLEGIDPMNICNRGGVKQGVQLEMSRKVRELLRTNRDQLHSFADAVRKAIQLYLGERRQG
jgi:phage replication-related protein YjqB (UPF0714/DUF867 family)